MLRSFTMWNLSVLGFYSQRTRGTTTTTLPADLSRTTLLATPSVLEANHSTTTTQATWSAAAELQKPSGSRCQISDSRLSSDAYPQKFTNLQKYLKADIYARVQTSIPSTAGCLFEAGDNQHGMFLGIIEKHGGNFLRLATGTDAEDVSSMNSAVLMISLLDPRIPSDGAVHELAWSISVVHGKIVLYIDGLEVANAQSRGRFPGNSWASEDAAGFGQGYGKVAAGGTPAAWQGKVTSTLTLWICHVCEVTLYKECFSGNSETFGVGGYNLLDMPFSSSVGSLQVTGTHCTAILSDQRAGQVVEFENGEHDCNSVGQEYIWDLLNVTQIVTTGNTTVNMSMASPNAMEVTFAYTPEQVKELFLGDVYKLAKIGPGSFAAAFVVIVTIIYVVNAQVACRERARKDVERARAASLSTTDEAGPVLMGSLLPQEQGIKAQGHEDTV